MSDEDLFELLMTSDLIEDYKPEYLKNLIFKFRILYKQLYNSSKQMKDDFDLRLEKIERILKNKETDSYNLILKNVELQDKLDLIQSKRKLSWKERIKGEISFDI